MRFPIPVLLAALAALPPLSAAAQSPEIERGASAPQAVGAVHTLRQIPEACARIEGVFTGDAAEPYRHAVVRTSERCQPRARFVDAARARPAQADGWILNDVLSVPRADCPGLQAVVKVWRRPAGEAPGRDGQGQVRVYADRATQAAAGATKAPAMYAAEVAVEGAACPATP